VIVNTKMKMLSTSASF